MTAGFARSLLFVPADRQRLVDSAFRSTADAIVLDLEDSIATDHKRAARDAVCSIVKTPRSAGPRVFVRLNAPGTRDLEEDRQALAGVQVAGFVVPKVESAAAVQGLAIEAGEASLILLLETPRAVLRALDIGEAAGGSLAALAFGAEDFSAAMGVNPADSDSLLAFALPAVAMAAAALGVAAIDAPEMSISEEHRLRARAAGARRLGFSAKFAIHPRQLAIIHEIFLPQPADRLWAEQVTRAYEQAVAARQGSIRVDGRVVDAATIKRARQILERSRT